MNRSEELFRQRRFGVFLHWGLYALPGGRWKGETMDYIGEWIQSKFRIPNEEYADFAAEFNPVRFNADEWIRLVKAAGANYIVYTAKHHDGFAMYDSGVSDFKIVKATPFGRDPLRELADACCKHDVALGIYYSHHLDWKEFDGGDPGPEYGKNFSGMSWGNDWDFPEHEKKDFNRYFDNKALPQITELLTNYGPVAELWCDCFLHIKKEHSEKLRLLVKKLQPECLINSRIGNNCGDFESLGDNQIMNGRAEKPVESPVTLNDTWGFKYDDENWKTPAEVAARLASLAGRDANILLNIGPGPDGSFPAGAVRVMEELAAWHKETRGMVAGSSPSPFPQEFDWGYCTVTGNRLNLFIRNRQPELRLAGIRNRVLAASVPFESGPGGLALKLPAGRRDSLLPVVTVELDGTPDIDCRLIPQNGVLTLGASQGKLRHGRQATLFGSTTLDAAAEKLEVAGHSLPVRDGTLSQWHNPTDRIEWELSFPEGGDYQVSVVTLQRCHGKPWTGKRTVELVWNGSPLPEKELVLDEELDKGVFRKGKSELGIIRIAPGEHGALSLRTARMYHESAADMNLAQLILTRKKTNMSTKRESL